MKTIIHYACKGELGTYSDNTLTKISPAMVSSKFTRVDGTSPKVGDKLNEKCPVCGRKIESWDEMEIGQDKVKDVWS